MKKTLLSLVLLLALVSSVNCTHVHNTECGYNESTQTGCTHECEDIESYWLDEDPEQ